VENGKIPCPYGESNYNSSAVQPVASRYTGLTKYWQYGNYVCAGLGCIKPFPNIHSVSSSNIRLDFLSGFYSIDLSIKIIHIFHISHIFQCLGNTGSNSYPRNWKILCRSGSGWRRTHTNVITARGGGCVSLIARLRNLLRNTVRRIWSHNSLLASSVPTSLHPLATTNLFTSCYVKLGSGSLRLKSICSNTWALYKPRLPYLC
jgi:hypothetical protein